MAEFKTIDPSGKTVEELLVEVAHAVNATHDCVHKGQIESKIIMRTMHEDINSLNGAVETLGGEVGSLKSQQTITDGYVKNLAEKFGAGHAPSKKTSEPVGLWSWKKTGLLSAALIAVVTLVTNAAVYAFFKGQFLAADQFLSKQAEQSQGQIPDAPKKKEK